MGLRNELRAAKVAEPVDWYTWYVHMTAAADAVHEADPDALLFFSGLSYDTYIDPIPLGKTLNGTAGKSTANKTAKFVPDKFAWKDSQVRFRGDSGRLRDLQTEVVLKGLPGREPQRYCDEVPLSYGHL
jgi:hypothetical protein